MGLAETFERFVIVYEVLENGCEDFGGYRGDVVGSHVGRLSVRVAA